MRRPLLALAVAVLSFAWLAPTAGAATVTVGSPMTAIFSSSHNCIGQICTDANAVLPEVGAHVTSPVTGTISQWRMTNTGSGQYAIRVLRPAGAGAYTGAGTSSQLVAGPGTHTFPAALPIQAGDLIGIDIPNGTGAIAATAPDPSLSYLTWPTGLADGATALPPSGGQRELAFNAEVTYTPPTPPHRKKRCKKRKHRRSAESAKKKKCKKKKRR